METAAYPARNTMPKRVLQVGNCRIDQEEVRGLIERELGAEVVSARAVHDALAMLRQGRFDLVLVNRKLRGKDASEGIELIRQIKSDPSLKAIPCMLLSDYPEAQQAAEALGAEPGFGKGDLHASATHERLRPLLDAAVDPA